MTQASAAPPGATPDPCFAPVETIDGRVDAGVLFLCDHAAPALPAGYGSLGLPAAVFEAPAVLSTFSRLLIDPNRGADDPTLVMRISDGSLIPGNARIDAAEIERRRRLYWQPYRAAVGAAIDTMLAGGPVPAVVSVHTFTPSWKGVARPWQIGILWDSDARLAAPLIAALAAAGLTVGDNEPYDGALEGDTLDMEVTRRGLPGVLVETRQDLVATRADAWAWADRLAGALRPLLARAELHTAAFVPSRTGRHGGPDRIAGIAPGPA